MAFVIQQSGRFPGIKGLALFAIKSHIVEHEKVLIIIDKKFAIQVFIQIKEQAQQV